MEIKHIIFDIGNVLIHWDSELAFLEQIPGATERRWFLDNICNQTWNVEQDRGRDWGEAEKLLIAQFPEHEENIRTFRRNWHLMIPHEISGSVAILEELLDAEHDVTMLTNFASDTFEIAKSKYQFLETSRGITVSADVGLIKPDIEIFQHHLRTFELSAGHCVFIDDSIKNVAGAIVAGWQAIHFQNAETLKDDLERFGIKL